MSDWRSGILAYFTSEVAGAVRLTLAADPDRLLAEQSVVEALGANGFDLIAPDDPMALRFVYERYRRDWGEGTSLRSLVVRLEGGSLEDVPFDLLTRARADGRVLRFSLAELFPRLAPNVVAELDRADLQRLFDAVEHGFEPAPGERGSRDFALRHVYDTAVEGVREPEHLLRLLLSRHYQGRQLPRSLDLHLIGLLRHSGRFADWPLEQIVADRQAFFTFLQERWPAFLRRVVGAGTQLGDPGGIGYAMSIPGPALLPFGHDEVRVYIDNLFVEGHLVPVRTIPRSRVSGTWMEWGVEGECGAAGAEARFRRLSEIVARAIPDSHAGYREWQGFAERWFEWSALRAEVELAVAGEATAEEIWRAVDDRFTEWMLAHYSSLHSVAYLPQPVMVHQVGRFLAHRHGGTQTSRCALLVVDGLAGSQWILLRSSIEAGPLPLSVEEGSLFAWVPTITPVSRQAIFAGESPLYFAATIHTTSRDEAHWRRFWEDRGFRGPAIQFVAPRAAETEEAFFERLEVAVSYPACRTLAAVIPTVDTMAHGTPTGARGLHAQVAHWAADGHFRRVVEHLVSNGFTVYVTSDHGNIECTGIGRPNVGVLAGERGERLHVFSQETMREKTKGEFKQTLSWPPSGLPADYLPLLAQGRGAFRTANTRVVSHGGISLDEVVVPFITIGGG